METQLKAQLEIEMIDLKLREVAQQNQILDLQQSLASVQAAATEAKLGIRVTLPASETVDTIGPWLRDLHETLPSASLHLQFDDSPDQAAWSHPTRPFAPKIAEALRSALERAVHTE